MENNKPKWDGKSRISNDTYRERWEEIYGQKEQEELKESYEQSLRNKKEREKNKISFFLKVYTSIVYISFSFFFIS